jgi:hypothetical protein
MGDAAGPVPAGLVEARLAGLCGHCGRGFSAGTEIAAHRRRWGHARCVGAVRPEVRSWLEERARGHPDVEIALLIAAGYDDAGDDEAARRYKAEAEAAIRSLVDPPAPPAPDDEHGDDYEPVDPMLALASHLLREVASGNVPGTALMVAAGRCLQQVDPGYAADKIRGMHIPAAPDGPATPEAVSARHALGILGEASRVGGHGDEDWTRCQDLITRAGKIALDVRPYDRPALRLGDLRPSGPARPNVGNALYRAVMSRSVMTVLSWTSQARRQDGSSYDRPTKRHVSVDGTATVCGFQVPQGASVIAVTADWHELSNCYNCVYRLWPDHAPPGYARPVSGSDFPLRRECRHSPGSGHDPLSCAPSAPPADASPPAAAPAPRPGGAGPGNPDPGVIRRWHIPCPYDHESCALCGRRLARGELVNIEYEAGVMHAACSDPPPAEQLGAADRAVGSDHPDPPASGGTVAVHDPFEGTEFIVLEFNPSTAGVSVLTTPRNGLPVTGYSDLNRGDAVHDASAAADRARAAGLPLRYAVVRIATEEIFPPSP